MPSQTTTELSVAGPSRNRYPQPNHSGSSAVPSGSMSAPPRGQMRPHEGHPQGSQFSPRHNKRRKTSHEYSEGPRRDVPPHLQDNRCQEGRPQNVPPLPHRKPNQPPQISPPYQPLPTPSSSRSPSSPYLPTQTAVHNNLPVPPLPSRASKRPATTSPAIVPLSNVPTAPQPSKFTLSTPAFPQPAQFEASTTPYRVPLPTSILPALRQLGITPVPWMALPPPDEPQPIAVLWHEKPDGKWVTLEINMSLVPPSQAANLAHLLSTVTTPRLLTLPSHPAPQVRFPAHQMSPTSLYRVPQPRPPHVPIPPAQQFVMRPLLPPPHAGPSTCPAASTLLWNGPPHPPQHIPPPCSPSALSTRRVNETPQPPPMHSLGSPTIAREQPSYEPPPLPSRRVSPVTPHKIKTEPPSTPSLFCSTPLPPSASYRPGEMVPEPRRLVQQACTRFMLPEDCHSDYNPQGYQNARRAFFKKKRQELKSKGLAVDKKVVLRWVSLSFRRCT